MATDQASPRLVVLNPTEGPQIEPQQLAPRPARLDGLVVGLLENGKLNSGRLLDLVAEEVARQVPVREFVRVRKPNASAVVPDEQIEELIAKAGIVITGIGD